jgi:hypothetical protein
LDFGPAQPVVTEAGVEDYSRRALTVAHDVHAITTDVDELAGHDGLTIKTAFELFVEQAGKGEYAKDGGETGQEISQPAWHFFVETENSICAGGEKEISGCRTG